MTLPVINFDIWHGYAQLIDLTIIEKALKNLLTSESPQTACELTVLFAGENRLRSLNRSFLGIDRATDVLSFPSGEPDPESGRLYLGDIAVCVPIAKKQANRAGHPLMNEVVLLTLHGCLHLLGFDHAKANERTTMWKRQQHYLQAAGLSVNRITEE